MAIASTALATSSFRSEFIVVLTNDCHTDTTVNTLIHSLSAESEYIYPYTTYKRVCISCRFLSFFFFLQVSHFLRVPQTLRQLIINAASWQAPTQPPYWPHTPLGTPYTFGKAYNNENVGAKANEPIKIPEAGSEKK